MKDCTGTYNYKGFSIMYSEYYQEWSVEPAFLFKEFKEINENKICDYICNYGRDFITECKTLKECKVSITEFLKNNGKNIIIKDFLNKVNC